MSNEDSLQEYLERLEAGEPLQEWLADLSPEESELVRLANTLREAEAPAMASEKAEAQRAHLMNLAAANLAAPGAAVRQWIERAQSALSRWRQGRSAFDWALYVGLAPAVLVLIFAALFGMFGAADMPVASPGGEMIALVEESAPAAVESSADAIEAAVAQPAGEGVSSVAADASAAASPDSAKHETFVPVVSISGLQSADTATLYGAQGAVLIQAADGTWQRVTHSNMIRAGQRVRVGAYSSAKLLFYDGSEAKLGPNSEITIDELNAMPPEEGFRTVVMTQHQGQSQHHVDFRDDAGSLYQVNTPTGSGIARGTTFNVLVAPDLVSQFSVEVGAVAVSNGENTVLVHAKQISTLSAGSAPTDPSFVVTGQGEVTAIAGAVWTIGGQVFTTDDNTIYIGDPGLNDIVLVLGHVDTGGLLVADQITKLRDATGNAFTIIGEVISRDDSTNIWNVAGQTISTLGADIEPGIMVDDLVKVEGRIQADGTWLAEEIKLLEDDFTFPVTVELIGYVDSINPWEVSGFPFKVDDATEIDANIAVDDLVKVTAVIQDDGSWLATEIRELGDDPEEEGCFTITAIVVGFSGDALVIDGWPELIIGDDVDIDGNIEAQSLVIIAVCIGADGTLTVESILVISGVFPPPPDDDDGADKVTLCHKPNGNNPHEITIARPAVQAHLNHGDTLGECDNGASVDDNGNGDDANGNNGQPPAPAAVARVDVCHNGRTLTLPEPAARAHLNHGDTMGACP